MFLSRARRSGVIVRNGAMSAGHGYLKGISRGVGDIPQRVSGELLVNYREAVEFVRCTKIRASQVSRVRAADSAMPRLA